MTQWKCFVQTQLLFVTIYGLVWSSSVTFKHKMTLVQFNVSLVVRDTTLSSNVNIKNNILNSSLDIRMICHINKDLIIHFLFLFTSVSFNLRVSFAPT